MSAAVACARIRERLAQIEADERFRAKPALVQINAPLALIQCTMKGEHGALRWVLSLLEAKP
jgi:hypothetical protein